MQQFEYKVVPAPQRGEKVRGARTSAERLAAAVMTVMNALGREGWEYLRADTLPCEERVGLTGRTSTFQHLLVFRRPLMPLTGADADARPDSAPVKPPARLFAKAPAGSAPRLMPFVKPGKPPGPAVPPGPVRPTD